MRRSLILPTLGLALVGVACGGPERGARSPTTPNGSNTKNKTPQALTIELSVPTAAAGTRTQLVARVAYDDGSSSDATGSATWVSSNPMVAEIVADGTGTFVEAKGEGTSQLTAVLGDLVARADFVVTPAGEVLVGLTLSPAQVQVAPGSQTNVSALGVYDSGAQRDVTGAATWQVADTSVATVEAGRVTGVAIGQTAITVTLGSVSQTLAVAVVDGPTVASLALSTTQVSLSLAGTQSVTAQATYSDGNTADVTGQASWTSSNPAVVQVSAGLLTAVGEGSAQISVDFMGAQASLSVAVTACSYPSGTAAIRQGAVLPNMSWTGVIDETGATRDFSTQSFFCDPEFAAYNSMVIIVGAEWCPNCPDYKRRANQMQPQIAAAGGLMVYVEIEDRQGRPANHQVAQRAVDAVIQNGVGLRIGDAETQPRAMVFGAATNSVPTGYVVRKSDMQVIGDQGQSQYLLDFVALAHQAAGSTPPMACGPSDEESFEPNNAPAQAGALTPGQVVSGGVCDANPDFYTVSHTGSWQLDLTFTHGVGDLDMYVWDVDANQPLEDAGGQPIGSDSSTDDESFTHSGPATVLVYGYNGATAPYQLRLTAN